MQTPRRPEDHPVYREYLIARNKPLVAWLRGYISSGDENLFGYFHYHWDRKDQDENAKLLVKKAMLFLEKQLLTLQEEKEILESREIVVLAEGYAKGIGVEKNIIKARELFERVQQQEPLAQAMLGYLYQEEFNDSQTAEYLYKSAAGRNCGRASFYLFDLYKEEPTADAYLLEGANRLEPNCLDLLIPVEYAKKAVSQPKIQLLQWTTMLVKNGYAGIDVVACIEHQHETNNIPQNPIRTKEALDFLIFCASLNLSSVLSWYLHILFREGQHVPKDLNKVALYLKKTYDIYSRYPNMPGKLQPLTIILRYAQKTLDQILRKTYAAKLVVYIRGLSPEELIAIFHLSLILKNKEVFNSLVNYPVFLDLAKQENWQEVVTLLTPQNALKVSRAIQSDLATLRNADEALPAAVFDLALQYGGFFHSSYLTARGLQREINDLSKFLGKCFREKNIPNLRHLQAIDEALCKINTNDEPLAAKKLKILQKEVARILSKPLLTEDLEAEKIRLLGIKSFGKEGNNPRVHR